MDLDETFIEGSDGYSHSFDTISRSIRNLNVLQDSRKPMPTSYPKFQEMTWRKSHFMDDWREVQMHTANH